MVLLLPSFHLSGQATFWSFFSHAAQTIRRGVKKDARTKTARQRKGDH
jgi:hypothetical protein